MLPSRQIPDSWPNGLYLQAPVDWQPCGDVIFQRITRITSYHCMVVVKHCVLVSLGISCRWHRVYPLIRAFVWVIVVLKDSLSLSLSFSLSLFLLWSQDTPDVDVLEEMSRGYSRPAPEITEDVKQVFLRSPPIQLAVECIPLHWDAYWHEGRHVEAGPNHTACRVHWYSYGYSFSWLFAVTLFTPMLYGRLTLSSPFCVLSGSTMG